VSAPAVMVAERRGTAGATARAARRAAGAVGVAGLLAALGASTWLVLAAAERPSVLSPPTLRAPYRWLRGPLGGALPHLTTDVTRLHGDYTTALVVLFVAWLVAWVTAPAVPVVAVAGAVALAHVVLLLGPPQPLTDVFNYIVYGRMAAHGLNPYTHIPLSAPHDAAYALSNWHHLRDPYGPLFTLLTEPVSVLPLPVAYWVWKSIVIASALATLALVWWFARRLGRSPQRALACAGLCPVTLAVGIGGFHNDMPAVLCVLGAVACLVRGATAAPSAIGRAPWAWDAGAGVLVIAAAGIKPSFAVIAPLVVLGAHRRAAVAAGAAAAAALGVLVVALAFGGALPAVGQQDRLVNPLSVPNVVGALSGHGGADGGVRTAARYVLVVVVAVAAAVVARRRQWALSAMGLVLLASVVSLSWVMPWYLAWSLPFAALRSPRALAPLAVLACLWLGVAGIPQMPSLLHDVGWYPTRSATGHANHEYEVELVR
jgi:Glycosyltransferase family 87